MKSPDEVKDLKETLYTLECFIVSARSTFTAMIDEFDGKTDQSYIDAMEHKHDSDALTVRNANLQDQLIHKADISLETLRGSVSSNPDVKDLLYKLLNMGELHNEEPR